MRGLVALIVLLAASLPTQRLEAQAWRGYQSCLDNSGGVTSAMRDCNSQEYAAQDGRFNANYRALLSILSEQNKKVYRVAQRSWITFRDDTCNAEAEVERPGTMALLIYDSCIIELTKNRADWLRSQFNLWNNQ